MRNVRIGISDGDDVDIMGFEVKNAAIEVIDRESIAIRTRKAQVDRDIELRIISEVEIEAITGPHRIVD